MLVFRDQSHVDRVREALWSPAGEGASVMIGSGLSRNALPARPGAAVPPLLGELVGGLAIALYPELANSQGTQGPVPAGEFGGVERLAMEYETAFGRSKLHEFLRNHIRDLDFSPSEIHQRLLRLPWRDVFTTNWDTLLERTRDQVAERAYSVILNMDEIPLARRPRIVKLHGSFPAQFPLILSEEDYRTYPERFAPFVNFVQQAMMESVMCLIGFSGDDPNFLHWSGWVRDNLGPAAPKIYLIGWLGLSPHRRRMLEDRNVVPIDLSHHPKASSWPEHLQHSNAVEWTLHALERGRPYDVTNWPLPAEGEQAAIPRLLAPVPEVLSPRPLPEENPNESSDSLHEIRQIIQVWGHNRRLYPDWVIMPEGEQRRELLRQTRQWENRLFKLIGELEPMERLQAVHELVWRYELLLEIVSPALESAAEDALSSVDCQRRTIDDVTAPIGWAAARVAWRSVALALLTAARQKLDQELFDKRQFALEPFIGDEADVNNRIEHERCLLAALQLDVQKLESLLDDWALVVCDPAWKIRKAALLWEVDRGPEARNLLKEALTEIRAGAAAGQTVAGASREGWALLSAFEREDRHEIWKRHRELARWKCDASFEMETIAEELRLTDGPTEPPMFDLGVKRRTVRYSNVDIEARAFRALRLTEVAGLPPFTHHEDLNDFDVSANLLRSAATYLAPSQRELAIRLVLRASGGYNDESLNRVVSRSCVAVLTSVSVRSLVESCIDFIRVGISRFENNREAQESSFWIMRLQVALEVLSRLALRTEPTQTEEILNLGLDCYSSHRFLSGPSLRRAAAHLLRRALEALQPDRRRARAVDLWRTPIVGLGSFSDRGPELYIDPTEVANSSDLLDARSEGNEREWQLAIQHILDGLLAGDPARDIAFRRLVPLAFAGTLKTEETENLARALWGDNAVLEDGLPDMESVDFDSVFLVLPEPAPGIAEQAFRKRWMSNDAPGAQTQAEALATLTQVGRAISTMAERGRTFTLSDEDSALLIEALRRWAEAPVPRPFSGAFRQPNALGENDALEAMKTILFQLTIPPALGSALFQRAKELSEQGIRSFRLAGPLTVLAPERANEIEDWIGAGLVSDRFKVAASAVLGLYDWLEASQDGRVAVPPSRRLVREVGNIIADRRSGALPQAMQFATWLFERNCKEEQQLVLPLALQGLSYMENELRYDRQVGQGEEQDVPLLRSLCVGLARSIANRVSEHEPVVERWLEASLGDPLPEVRNAARN